jgi:hypothetical protein
MSKEKTTAWRSMRANQMAETAPVQPTPADAQTMREMWAQASAPAVTAAPVDAMYQIWGSPTKRVIAGRWYIPIGEVTRILTAEPALKVDGKNKKNMNNTNHKE